MQDHTRCTFSKIYHDLHLSAINSSNLQDLHLSILKSSNFQDFSRFCKIYSKVPFCLAKNNSFVDADLKYLQNYDHFSKNLARSCKCDYLMALKCKS